MPLFGREIVCGVAGEIGEGRVCAVRRLTWASSLVRCLRRSSSLSFMESARSTNASGVDGREFGAGRARAWRAASGEDARRTSFRQQANTTRPARNKNGTPGESYQRCSMHTP